MSPESGPTAPKESMRDCLLLAALVVLWLADFYLDVRHRDGFTWMDPDQYFGFARGLVDGSAHLKDFGVPTIFPLFIAPFLTAGGGIPMAFCVNALAAVALVGALALLRRETGLSTPTFVIAAIALSSPLLTGLSRELYVEFFLTALAAFNLWLALRLIREFTWGRVFAFGALFVVGFLTKMTFPVLAAVPLAGAVVGDFLAGRWKRSSVVVASVVVPLAIALGIAWILFPGGREYYRTLGNTTIPVMRLIGPGMLEPVGAYFYYFIEIFRNQFWLVSPFVLVAVIVLARRAGRMGWESLRGPRAALWLAFLLPLVLLGFSAVREPRHVASVTVPAVLLIVMAVEAIPKAVVRRAALALACVLAVAQYAWVSTGHRDTPYFVDHAFHHQEILSAFPARADEALSEGLPPQFRVMQWKFNRNLAITGFSPNEALAMNWQVFPGIVFDLETVGDGADEARRIPYEGFEDLFLLSAFNTYNRRCGVEDYYQPLTRREVVENAEFIIAKVGASASQAPSFAGHTLSKTLEFGDDRILIFESDRPVEPYRRLYAQRYIDAHPSLSGAEKSAIAYNLMTVDMLRGDFEKADELVRRFPVLSERPRNIYWIGGYEPLMAQAQGMFQNRRSRRQP